MLTHIYNKGLALNPGKRIDAEEYFVKAKQLGHTSS
jgi:hypothetical protein